MDIAKNLGLGLLKGLIIAGAISYFFQVSSTVTFKQAKRPSITTAPVNLI